MPFMLVCGKIFVCKMCGAKARVEYVGGAQMTRIGDDTLDFSELASSLGMDAESAQEKISSVNFEKLMRMQLEKMFKV